MKIGFEHPYYTLLALAIPALIAIYLYYRRSGRRIVPAIFLWDRPDVPVRSGSRLQFRRFPLSFYLELLVLLGFLGGAVAPFFFSGEKRAPLVVVLDNSYSMRALNREKMSTRDVLQKELERQLQKDAGRKVTFILAGLKPRQLESSLELPFDLWRADETAADLAGALALGRLLNADAEFRVFTDHAPEFPLPEEVGWYAAGTSQPNAGWTDGRRRGNRVLLQALNASGRPQSVGMTLIPGGERVFDFAAGEQKRMLFQFESSGSFTARLSLPGDPLAFDDEILLLSEGRPPLRTAFQGELPERVKESIGALADFTLSGEPEFLIVPAGNLPEGKFHRFIWHTAAPENAVWSGELIVSRSDSDFTRGLELSGLRWAADAALKLPGRLLLRRGDVPLLTEVRRVDGFTDLHFNASLEKSNLLRHPFWPSLLWNVSDTLRRERPGPEFRNYRSGELVRIKAPAPETETLELTAPDGTLSSLAVVRQYAHLAEPVAGLYQVKSGESEWEFSVTALSAAESDLSGCSVFRKEAVEPGTGERPRRRAGWLLLALSAAVLVIHQGLLAGKRGEK